MTGSWAEVAPYPAPRSLSPGYDRHAASASEVRGEVERLVGDLDWAGATWPELLCGLLALGRTDVPLSRLAEGHVDAVRILRQAGRAPEPGALYGVWASRSQGTGVAAERRPGGLALSGTVRFASGTGVLDRALLPVWLGLDEHVLLDLPVADLPVDDRAWATAAMTVSRSHTVVVERTVPEEAQVGPTNFYLGRPAFLPGGVGVAACWAGGAARVADLAAGRLSQPSGPLLRRLGRLRVQLAAAGAVLSRAGAVLQTQLSAPEPDGRVLQILTVEARAVVADAVHVVLEEATRLAGPAGLAFDADLTHAVHDLQLYVLQQNADADAELLGRTVAG